MKNNILRADLDKVISFLKTKDPILTQSKNVKKFEEEWSKWLGSKYSVFVNSGSSANLLSLAIMKHLYGEGEIIVPSLTWVSDVASIIQNNFKPVFVDINEKNLCMDTDKVIKAITKKTKAVFITYAQGFNGLDERLLKYLKEKKIPLIEDVCESHGATYKNKKLGSYGLMSNFSFYYAHHMTTIEGGMISTNNKIIYENLRALRSHGMVREMEGGAIKNKYINKFKDLNPSFIFLYPAYNVRNTEIGAILGRSQLKRLDRNIKMRNDNHRYFLKNLNPTNYFIDFDLVGSSNYAFNIILKKNKTQLVKKLINIMKINNIEFRRGSAGGGNQLRQPYLNRYIKKNEHLNHTETEHIHFYGFYIGNFPSLSKKNILKLCTVLNSI